MRWAWTGYAAFVVGLLFAVVSVYWAAGGTAGLDTLGGQIEELARARDPTLVAVVWVTAALKLIGAVLGLALAQAWGRRVPRWILLSASWAASTILVLYGGLQITGLLLVLPGVAQPDGPVHLTVIYWRLFLWEPWFLVWGLLLGAATWAFARSTRT